MEIVISKNGPYLIKGGVPLLDADGNTVTPPKDSYALCRCGASANKPFCDGQHRKCGFEG